MRNGASHGAPKTVAIVGLGPSRVTYIEQVDKAGDRYALFDEVWTFNSFCNVIESDRLFHMDDVVLQEMRAEAGNTRVRGMLEAMKRYKGPIYTSVVEPGFPTMEKYPLAEVVGKFNSLYFTTTPPYALAYAGLIGVSRVFVFGCDYTWPGLAEAEGGRSCMEYWIGRLHGMGMDVRVAPTSSLCDAHKSKRNNIQLYGYDRFQISLEETEVGVVKLKFESKELPSAEEIEERYNHKKSAFGVSLDVVN